MNRASIYFRVVVELTSIFQSFTETLEGFSVFGLGRDSADRYIQQLLGFQDLLFSVALDRKVEVSYLGLVKGRVKSLLKLVYI